MKKLIIGKRGVTEEIPIFLVILLVVAILGVFIYICVMPLFTNVRTAPFFNQSADSPAQVSFTNGINNLNSLDMAFVFLYVMLALAIIGISFLLPSNPFLMFLMIFIFIVSTIGSVYVSTMMISWFNTITAISVPVVFPKSYYIFQHLPLLVFIPFAIASIVFFGKIRSGP